MNLLMETVEALRQNNLTISDIEYVSDGESYSMWHDFAMRADEVNYDEGYGRQEINHKLVVMLRNGWLEREEYGGLENWIYKQVPVKPKIQQSLQLWDGM